MANFDRRHTGRLRKWAVGALAAGLCLAPVVSAYSAESKEGSEQKRASMLNIYPCHWDDRGSVPNGIFEPLKEAGAVQYTFGTNDAVGILVESNLKHPYTLSYSTARGTNAPSDKGTLEIMAATKKESAYSGLGYSAGSLEPGIYSIQWFMKSDSSTNAVGATQFVVKEKK